MREPNSCVSPSYAIFYSFSLNMLMSLSCHVVAPRRSLLKDTWRNERSSGASSKLLLSPCAYLVEYAHEPPATKGGHTNTSKHAPRYGTSSVCRKQENTRVSIGRRTTRRAEDTQSRASCQAAADMHSHRACRVIMCAHAAINKASKERRRRAHRHWRREASRRCPVAGDGAAASLRWGAVGVGAAAGIGRDELAGTNAKPTVGTVPTDEEADSAAIRVRSACGFAEAGSWCGRKNRKNSRDIRFYSVR